MGVKTMKKVLAILMVCLLIIVSGGCAGNRTDADAAKSTSIEPGKDSFIIGWVYPKTGPLAPFGETVEYVSAKAMEIVNKDGGIYVEEYGKKLPIKVIAVDCESNSTKASEAASKLIQNNKVDIIIATQTPDIINPVSAAAERNKVPCIVGAAPIESWLTGGPYYWSFGNLFSLDTLVNEYFDAWDLLETNKKVSFLYTSGVDGVVLSGMVTEKAGERGYTVVDPGRFPDGTKDFTALISQIKQESCDIVVGALPTPDFSVAWKQFHQMGYIPKIVTMGITLQLISDLEALGGDLGLGLTYSQMWNENYPYRSSLFGKNCNEWAQQWIDETGKWPNLTLGIDSCVLETAIDALKRAQSVDKEKIRAALEDTDMETLSGHIKYNDEHVAETTIVIAQWTKGTTWPWERNVIATNKFKEIPLSPEGIFPIPGSK